MSHSKQEPAALLYLSRSDVAALVSLNDCIEVVEAAFKAHAEGRLPAAPGVLGTHLPDGGLHVKTAAFGTNPCYLAAKANANYPDNPARFGLPTIQGLILLFDGERGTPLAVMDSIEINILRTAAATAVAAKHLARPQATTVGLIGCGVQGGVQVRAVAAVRPIRRVFTYDSIPERAQRLAALLGAELGIEVRPVRSAADAIDSAEIWITTTPSRASILFADMLRPGVFIAAVGADNPHKQELDPELLRRTRVVVDLLDQAATMGDLHHALAAGVMTHEDVHAELGQVVAGQRSGRSSDDEVFVFDSTGTALQDVAAAALAYQRAIVSGRGTRLSLD
jgi:alanine dehydrogenase